MSITESAPYALQNASHAPRHAEDSAPHPPREASIGEYLLKNQAAIDQLLADPAGQRWLIPQLLGVSMAGIAIYGVVATMMLNLARSSIGYWLPYAPPAFWNGPSAANLTIAYTLGLIAANGICLPSFYFYGLLAGVPVTLVSMSAHALRGMAATSVALVGILPIYVAIALNGLIYGRPAGLTAWLCLLGLALPFLAGTWGVYCLYRGFIATARSAESPSRRRGTLLLERMILAWSGCYTFITPLVIYSLWEHLGRVLR